ncbi:acyl-CoA synthetase [Paenibacillus sp. YSY-4.3]
MLITDAVRAHAARNPEKTALVVDHRRLTYEELDDAINEAACELMTFENSFTSDGPAIVGFLLHNSVEFVQYFLAAAQLGLCSALFDPKWADANIEAIIQECRPAILIVGIDLLPRIASIPNSTNIIVIDSESAAQEFTDHNRKGSPTAAEARQRYSLTSKPDSIFYMGFTSGTTGTPKGFLRAQHSWMESFAQAKEAFGLSEADHVLGTGPLVHSLTIYAAIQTLYLGGTFYLSRKFNAEQAVAMLGACPITHIYLVPTIFEALYHTAVSHTPVFAAPYVKSLITTGDKWTPESKRKAGEVFPQAGIYEFYGASELSFVTVLDPIGNQSRPDSIGKPFNGVEVSIRKPDGTESGVGEVGQVYIRSGMIFSGYFNNEDETKQVIHGEWATVGDLAMKDSEGFLYMVGRSNNMIISGGLNIYPEEIEKALLSLDEIEEAVIAGLPDAYWGQKVVAIVKAKQGAVISDQEIMACCRKRLASYKCPKAILRVDSFPYTNSGKISRASVNEWLAGKVV